MSTSVASVVSHFPEAENGFTTTTAGSVSSGAVTVTLNSVAGYTNGEPVVLVIDPTDPAKKQTFTGIVDTGGVQVTSVVWTAGTNQTHALGATVVDYATATHISMISKGIKVDHSQAGAHEIATNYDPSNPTLETQKWAGVASAVNEITVTNAATGNFPTISATGEADTGIDFENSEGEEILKLDAVATAVNEITITNAVTTASPQIAATGGDTNIDLTLAGKGTGTVDLPTDFKGKVHYRKGGSATVWGTAGTTTYDTANEKVLIQAGTTANSSSPTAHTFPVAYTYAPVVVANVVTASGANTFAVVSSVTASGFNCQVITDAGAGNTSQTINWVAIGV